MDERTTGHSTHDLLLALAGRVDDDLLAWCRELVAVGEDGYAIELLTATLIADGTAMPADARAALVAAGRAARSDLDAGALLPPAADGAATVHRFDPALPLVDHLTEVVAGLPARLTGGCRLHVTARTSPAGAAPGPLPHPVVLAEIDADDPRPVDVLAYQLAIACARAGTVAAVEVLVDGSPPPEYQRSALAAARPVPLGEAPPAHDAGAPAAPAPPAAAPPAPAPPAPAPPAPEPPAAVRPPVSGLAHRMAAWDAVEPEEEPPTDPWADLGTSPAALPAPDAAPSRDEPWAAGADRAGTDGSDAPRPGGDRIGEDRIGEDRALGNGASVVEADLLGAGVHQADPGRTEVGRADAGSADAGRVDAVRVDTGRVDRDAADVAEPDPADLGRTDVSRADLERADLERADLERADLDGAGLGRADSERADVERAGLERVDLGRADLGRRDVSPGDAGRSDMGSADMGWADMGQVDRDRADRDRSAAGLPDPARADVDRSAVDRAEPGRADLGWADVDRADDRHADVTRADVSDTAADRAEDDAVGVDRWADADRRTEEDAAREASVSPLWPASGGLVMPPAPSPVPRSGSTPPGANGSVPHGPDDAPTDPEAWPAPAAADVTPLRPAPEPSRRSATVRPLPRPTPGPGPNGRRTGRPLSPVGDLPREAAVRPLRSSPPDTPALAALNDPLRDPLPAEPARERPEPTIDEQDPLGLGRQPLSEEEPRPPAADSWLADWITGDWAMPSADQEPGPSPAEPPPAEPLPAEPPPADDPAPRPVSQASPRPVPQPPAPLLPAQSPAEQPVEPQRVARLSDADRELLSRLQSELGDAPRPRVSRRAGIATPPQGRPPRPGPPDRAG